MTHTDFLARLDPVTRRVLTALSDGPALVHLAAHIGLIALLAFGVASRAPFWPLLVPPLGIATVFLFTLQHECTHRTPFRTGWLNEAIGHVCAALLVQPFLWFRYFHLAHHRYTNDPERDPELVGADKPQTWPAYVWHVSSIGYWRAKVSVLFSNAFGQPQADYLPHRTIPRIRREARILLALYGLAVAALTAWPSLFWIWPGPLVIGFPALRLYLLAEHARCPAVANMFDNTRTTLTNRLVRFLAWNMPYHAEHHAAPAVPFHKLPALHGLTREHLGVIEDGYTAFTAKYVQGLKRQDSARLLP